MLQCFVKRNKNNHRRKTRNPHPTPGGRVSLAEREPFGLIQTEPRPCGHTPRRGWQLQGTTVHGQKMQRGQRVKRSGHCASSIKEKPTDWDPECRSRKSAWQRHLFLDLCPAGGGNLPQLYALYLTSRMLYSTMAGISNQSPTSSGTKRKPKLWGKI